jgi:hypothetical protein
MPLIFIKVVTCVFVLAADGVGGEALRGAPFSRQPGPGDAAGAWFSSNDVPALLFM